MSTDGQGRPLSDDGQWAWDGTEWVPAAIGGAVPPPAESDVLADPDDLADPGATVITASPFARGGATDVDQSGHTGAPVTAQPTPNQPTPNQPTPNQITPGYVGSPGAPPAPKDSRRTLIISIVVAVIIIAVVAVLVVTLSDDKKSGASPNASAGPAGAYVCTAPGSTDTGTITFSPGMKYSLSSQTTPGTYTLTGVNLTFIGGSLGQATGTYTAGTRTVQVVFNSLTLICKQ